MGGSGLEDGFLWDCFVGGWGGGQCRVGIGYVFIHMNMCACVCVCIPLSVCLFVLVSCVHLQCL